jgi:hypothetical protein
MAKRKEKQERRSMVLELDAAGIDIGAEEIYVAVPPDRDEESTRRFSSFTGDLHALADWLGRCRVRSVALLLRGPRSSKRIVEETGGGEMTCLRTKLDQLIQYVDGSLLPDEVSTITAHLSECRACEAEVAELQSIVAAVAQVPEPVEPERDLWAALAPALVKPDRLVSRLREAIALRDVAATTRLAEDCRDRVAELDPCEAHSAALLDAFTQVLDMGMAHRGSDLGYSYLDVAKAAFARFPKYPRDGVRLDACAHLEMVEGILGMHAEQFDGVNEHL